MWRRRSGRGDAGGRLLMQGATGLSLHFGSSDVVGSPILCRECGVMGHNWGHSPPRLLEEDSSERRIMSPKAAAPEGKYTPTSHHL